jgi:hypothetical protein
MKEGMEWNDIMSNGAREVHPERAQMASPTGNKCGAPQERQLSLCFSCLGYFLTKCALSYRLVPDSQLCQRGLQAISIPKNSMEANCRRRDFGKEREL